MVKLKNKENNWFKSVTSLILALLLVISLLPSGCLPQAFAENKDSQTSDVTTPTAEEQEEGRYVRGRVKSAEEVNEQVEAGGVVDLIDDSEVDYSIKGKSVNFETDKATNLPSKVDLRTKGIVTDVTNQYEWGCCWAFSANEASEMSIATTTGKSPVNLSPFHTAWFGYTPLSTTKSDLKGTQISQAGEGSYPKSSFTAVDAKMSMGGGKATAPSVIMQGTGTVLNTDYEYDNYYLKMKIFGRDVSLSTTDRVKSLTRLKKWNILGVPNAYADWGKMENGTNMTVIERMKSAINDGYGVAITYQAAQGDNAKYINSTTYAQYIDTKMGSNHAVCVVGYDDDYAVSNFNSDYQPPAKGAFIVKNSWGTDQQDGGYFYLSYYDKSLNHASTYEYDTETYDGKTYINTSTEVVDQYDYLQANYMGYQSADWYSNVYTTFQKQKLHNIATYYSTPGEEIQYKVYRLKDNATSPADVAYSLDAPDAEGTYVNDYEGFVSIKLETPVSLKAGEKYAIWFSGDAPQAVTAGPAGAYSNINWVSTSIINSGESFYYRYSKWNNYTTSQSVDGSDSYDNFCVKGYSTVQGNTSTITFDTFGGSSVPTQTITDGNKVSQPPTPTKDGFTFEGWYRDKHFVNKYDFDETVTHDVTLYAKFSAKVTYELNGGTNSSKNPDNYVFSVGVESFADPTKTAYDFAGWWSKNGTEDGNWGTQITSISTTDSGDKTLYARWTPHAYSVTYVDEKAGVNTNVKSYTIEDGDITLADAVKEGYDFLGWYKIVDSKVTEEKIATIKSGSSGDLSLSAKWAVHNYSITYENTQGAVNDNPSTYTIETQDFTLVDAEKTAYVFDGWWTKDGTEDGEWGSKVTKISKGSTKDKVFYAKWKVADLVITYANVDGATNPNPSSFTTDEAITLKDASKPGYVFDGWYDESGDKVTEIPKGTKAAITLSAKWTAATYSITYKNCSGATNPNKTSYVYKQATFALLDPTKAGYSFVNWTDSNGNAVSYVYSGTMGNLTFSANWKLVTYSITYENIDGATNPNSFKTYTIESSTITLKNPTKDGATFVGWYSKQGSSSGDWGKQITKINKGSFGNITLYAKWSDDEAITMHRLYNKWTGEHFYTSDDAEKEKLVKIGWNDEGVGWSAPATSSKPVYRLYNPYVEGGDHHYTMDATERDSLVKGGWSDEGVGWYSDENEEVPLYRQYNPYAQTGTHNYTTSKSENDKLVKAGWRAEGISWYGVKAN